LQAYYDHTERSQPAVFADTMDIFDVELQHAFALGTMHKIVWGGGYRYAHDRVDNDLLVAFIPARKDLSWTNVFVEDQVHLARNVELTIGAKVETNVYTGAEFLPTLRLAWKPADNHLLWTAASRAVRAPARIDREFFFPGTPPFLINGGPDFESEVANVFEIGYRGQLANAFSYSITAFHTIWDKLRSGQPAPAVVQNMIHGTTDGIEAWASYQLTRSWRMSGGVSTVTKDLELRPGSTDPTGPSALGNDPRAQWMVRSLLNLTDRHELDITFRHVSALPDPAVPEYTTVDLRLGWRPRPDLEVSLTVNNVFEPSHAEFDAAAARSEYERNWFLKVLWRF
jgi:iron complex outermembrane receptor protein